MSQTRAEVRAGGETGRVPPGGRRVVGDRDKGAAHALRASADGFIDLRGGRRRARHHHGSGQEAANDGSHADTVSDRSGTHW